MLKILDKFKYGQLIFDLFGATAIAYGIYKTCLLFSTPTFKALWTMASS